MVSEPEARHSHAEAGMSHPTPATQSFKAHAMVETCLSGDESDSPATDDINQFFFDDSVIQLPGHGLSVQGNDWPGEPQASSLPRGDPPLPNAEKVSAVFLEFAGPPAGPPDKSPLHSDRRTGATAELQSSPSIVWDHLPCNDGSQVEREIEWHLSLMRRPSAAEKGSESTISGGASKHAAVGPPAVANLQLLEGEWGAAAERIMTKENQVPRVEKAETVHGNVSQGETSLSSGLVSVDRVSRVREMMAMFDKRASSSPLPPPNQRTGGRS